MVEVQIAPPTIDITMLSFVSTTSQSCVPPSLSLAILSVLIIIASSQSVALTGGRRMILSLAYVLHVSPRIVTHP